MMRRIFVGVFFIWGALLTAQSVVVPTTGTTVELCGDFPQTVSLPDLTISEIDAQDFNTGQTQFVIRANAGGVRWETADLGFTYSGPSQSTAFAANVNGADLEVTVDLAANTSLESFTFSGLQLVLDIWDFTAANSIDITIEAPATGLVYTFQANLSAFTLDLLNAALTTGTTRANGNSGTFVYCAGTVTPILEVDGNQYEDPSLGNPQWQWQYFENENWVDIPTATDATYQPSSLLQDRRFRRKSTSIGGCDVYSAELLVKVNDYLPGSISFSDTTVLTDFTVCEDTSVTIFNETSASAGATGAQISYEWYVWEPGGVESLIVGATNPYYTIANTAIYPDGTRFFRRAFAELDGFTCTVAGKDSPLLTLNKITLDSAVAIGPDGAAGTYEACVGEVVMLETDIDPANGLAATYTWERLQSSGAWLPVANGPTYTFTLGQGAQTLRRRTALANSNCSVASEPIVVTGYGITAGQIQLDTGESVTQICDGAPLPIVRSVQEAQLTPSSSTVPIAYTWEISTFDGTAWSAYTTLAGATGPDLTLGFPVTQRSRFRRRASIDTTAIDCAPDSGLSNEITIDVITGLTGGSAGVVGNSTSDYVVCEGEDPLVLEVANVAQPDPAASLGYQWEMRMEGTTQWFPVPVNGTAPTLTLDAIISSASYRRLTYIINGECEVASAPVNLWYNAYDAGEISWNANQMVDTLSICAGSNVPQAISLQDGNGPNYPGAGLVWLWQYSEDGGQNWTDMGTKSPSAVYPGLPLNLTGSVELRRLAFSQWTINGQTSECVVGGKSSNILYVDIQPEVDGGAIDATVLNQSLCDATVLPSAITVTDTNDTGTLPLAYQWERFNAISGLWEALLGETGASLVFTSANRPLATTRYRRATYLRDMDLGNICVSYTNNEAEVQVFTVDAGQVAVSDSYVCYGDQATLFDVSLPISSPNQLLDISWQVTTDPYYTMDPSDVSWTSIAQNQLELQTAPFLDTQETTYYYRRVVTPEFCTPSYSNIIEIRVLPQIESGTAVAENQDICAGDVPGQLSVAVSSPLSGNLSYQWFQRTNPAAVFAPIPLAQGATYSPGPLTTTTYFYREAYFPQNNICAASSSELEVRVHDLNPGIISGTQTLCEGAVDIALGSVQEATVAYGGTITYQWEQTTAVNNPDSWVDVNEPSANNAVLTVSQVPPTDIHYRRRATVEGLGCVDYSNVVTLQVITHTGDADIQFVGFVGNSFVFCSGTLPLISGVESLQSSAQQIGYRWYESNDSTVWNLISGATSSSYQPSVAVGEYSYYKREVVLTSNGVSCVLESNILEVGPGNPNVIVNAGSIFATDTSGTNVGAEVLVCPSGTPNTFFGDESQIGYSGDPSIEIPFTYQWFQSTDGIRYTAISGATGKDYTESGVLSQTTYYWRLTSPVYDGVTCSAWSSNRITVLVPQTGTVDIRSNTRVICPGESVQTLVSSRTIPQSELSTMTFQWWERVGSGTWSPIAGATNQTYTPQNVTETTSYKRIATYDVDGDNNPDCGGGIESNEWTVRVNTVDPGRIDYNGTMVNATTVSICYGAQPEPLITDASVPYSIAGTQVRFQWQVSSDGLNWTDLGANAENFQPPALQQDTWYRRKVGSVDFTGRLCWSNTVDENIIRFEVLPEVMAPVLVDNIGLACANDTSPGFLQIDNYNTDPNLTYIWEQSNDKVIWEQVMDGNAIFGGEVWNVPQLFETTYYRVRVVPTGFSQDCARISNVIEVPVVSIDAGYLRFLTGGTSEHYQATCAQFDTDILIGSELAEAPSAPGYENSYEVFWESRPYIGASDWTEIDFTAITADPLGNTLRIYDGIQTSRYFRRGIRVPTSNGSFCLSYSNPVLVEVMESPQIGIFDTDPYITDVLCPGEATGAITLSGTGAVSGGIPTARQQQVSVEFTGSFDVGDIFMVNINGSAFTFTAGTGDSLNDVASALATDINNGQNEVQASAQQNRLLLVAAIAGTAFDIGTLLQTDKNVRMDVTYLQANHTGLVYEWVQLANGIPVNGFVDPGTLDLTDVPAGDYQLSVSNGIDCTTETTPVFTITEPDPLPGTVQRSEGNTACVGEDILLTVNGSTDYTQQTYQWESSSDGVNFDPIQISGVDAQSEDLIFPDIQNTTFFRRVQYLTGANGAICAGGASTSPPYQIIVLDPLAGSIMATEPVVCVDAVPGPIIPDPSLPSLNGVSYYRWESTQDLMSSAPIWSTVQGAVSEQLSFNAPLGASTKFRRFSVIEQSGVQCVSAPTNEVTITLENPPVIQSTVIQDNGVIHVSCNGAQDGSITLTDGDILFPSSGPDPATATYRWINLDDPSYMATTASISDLGPGRYQLELTYSHCVVLSNYITITEPAPFAMDLQASCNGTLETGVSGGSQSYQYTLEHPNGFVEQLIGFENHVFPNLIPGGSYTLIVDDLGDRSCPPIQGEITIPLGLQLNAETIQAQAVSCYGAADGAILMNVGDVTIQGGVAPFQIEWVSPSGATFISNNPTQLEAGTYVLTVTDQLGCSASTAVDIGSADLLEITQNQVINQDLSCTGDADASIAILVQGDPNRSYQIDWYKNNTSYASNSTEITGLAAGSYRVEVYYTDSSNGNCRIIREFEIREPQPFTADLVSVTDVGCDASLGGAVTIAAQGGTLPYRIALNGGAFQSFNSNQFTLSGIPAGSQQIVVTDSNGCAVSTFPVSLTANEPITLSYNDATDQQPINCDQTGSLSIRASGGAPPYFYEWTGPSFSKSGADLTSIADLTLPGTYTVVVTDANQCQSETVTMILEDVTQGFVLEAVLGDVGCVGPTNPTSISLNIGETIVAPYTIVWEKWALLDPNNSTCTVDCYGWVRLSGADGSVTYTEAVPGNYRITVTDSSEGNSCSVQEEYITVPEGLVQIVDPVLTLPECNVADGRLSFSVEHIDPIQLYLNGNPVDANSAVLSYDTLNDRYSLNSLPPGDYFVEAQLQSSGIGGCSATYAFTVEAYNPIAFTGETNFILDACEASPVFELPSTLISGGNPFYGADGEAYYNLEWTGPNNFGMSGVSSITVGEGEYQLLISDASGCTSEPVVFSFTDNYEPIQVTSSIVQPGCDASSSGSITIQIEGGKPVYDILWEVERINADGSLSFEEVGRAFTALNDLEAGRYRLTVWSDLPNCSDNNPARRYMRTFTLGGAESLGLVEGPFLSDDLCQGNPGVVTLQVFDNTGADEGAAVFYYNGGLVVSDYKGNGDYEVYIDQPVDNAQLSVVNPYGCQLVEQISLGVPEAAFAYSSPNFDSSGTLFEQEEISFINQTVGDFAWAVWNFGDGTELIVDPATDASEVVHTYEFSGTYEVSLEVFNASGCSRRYSESLPVGLGYQLLFPNAFTPNGDGINEYFEGEFTGIESFQLSIYNTWGGLVSTMAYTHAEKPLHWGWDGNYADGSPYTQKYFRYVFTAITIKGEQVTRAGEAVILR